MTFNNYKRNHLDKGFSSSPNYINRYAIFTIAALEDEVVRVLSSHNTFHLEEHEEGNDCIRIKWDYLDQAEALLYRTNVYNPLPEFVIFSEDIQEGLARELKGLGKVTMDKVVTNAVRRLYEFVDPKYFHINGIYGKVKWRFGRSKK